MMMPAVAQAYRQHRGEGETDRLVVRIYFSYSITYLFLANFFIMEPDLELCKSKKKLNTHFQLVRDAYDHSRESGGSATAVGDEPEHIPTKGETTVHDPAVVDETVLLAAGAGDIIETFEHDEELVSFIIVYLE